MSAPARFVYLSPERRDRLAVWRVIHFPEGDLTRDGCVGVIFLRGPFFFFRRPSNWVFKMEIL